MTLMLWCTWEENGWDDSDFFNAYWDTEKGEAIKHETASTRYGGGAGPLPDAPWTPQELERARVWLAGKIFERIRAAEYRDVLEPQTVTKGARVRLLEKHRRQAEEEKTEPCDHCGNTGVWTNPRNPQDQRECRACHGEKVVVVDRKKLVDAKGKKIWVNFEPGLAGEVFWTGTFRKIYAKGGYNRLGRSTLSVGVKFDDGRKAFLPMEKLRLDKEPMNDEELRQRADAISYSMECKPLLTAHGGWLTTNEAAAAMKNRQAS